MKEGGLTARRFFKQFACRIPMRSLYYRIGVTREVLPASFFIEEVNKFLELLFLDEDECIFFIIEELVLSANSSMLSCITCYKVIVSSVVIVQVRLHIRQMTDEPVILRQLVRRLEVTGFSNIVEPFGSSLVFFLQIAGVSHTP